MVILGWFDYKKGLSTPDDPEWLGLLKHKSEAKEIAISVPRMLGLVQWRLKLMVNPEFLSWLLTI